MSGSPVEDYGTAGSSNCIEGMSNEQRCLSTDSLGDWRSCEQVENGTPSTSPPYWDTDDDDDDDDVCGAKPSDLYGKSTWKIENFSQITKRELRSNAFDVGGYKWYILIYPQGCDVSNHLSLFLCVANHDKLLPGWSHFAQFTIAVVNKDPKKSKYSADTLHRFWKKEHDWGWKKFMELSRVSDGFIVADTLVIKAQVQVIREKAHRPFRCLDRHYRRELVRVYLSNVEQICRRFVEERRGKLSKLIEDKMRWSSFRAFWLGIDQITRRRMSRDKTDTVLKGAVKHFFIEKEVTSTLVMDSLYSGLKALECQSKNTEGREKLTDIEELPAPMVHVEEDMFVLSDDVLLLLERATLELLPHQPSPPKDDTGSQNRTKESSGEESMKDSIERYERRLTELGRRTVEIFILAHIFSRIEVAYQEVVALKRQEELIREEEAAGLIEIELKAKRGAAEKEKRTKKKQGKHKRNTRKGKDRGRDEKSDMIMQEKHQPESRLMEDLSLTQAQMVIGSTLVVASDPSDAGDNVPEALLPELDDRDTISVNWDTDTSEIHPATEALGSERQNEQSGKRSPSIIDDSCSTCSTDSVPSVVMNGPYQGNSLPYNKSQMSPVRVNNQSRDTHDWPCFTNGGNNPTDSTTEATHLRGDPSTCRDSQPEPEAAVLCLKDHIQRIEKHLVEKEEQVVSLQKKFNVSPQKKFDVKDPVEVERPYKLRSAVSSSSPSGPWKTTQSGTPQSKQSVEKTSTTAITTGIVGRKEVLSINPARMEKSVPLVTKSLQVPPTTRSEAQKLATSKNTTTHQVPAMSRPSSSPLNPSPRPAAPVVSTVQTMPLLSHSVSAVGRLGTDPSPSAPNYVPQSYRNAIMGKTSMSASSASFTPLNSTSLSQVVACSQSASAFQSSMLPSQSSARNGPTSVSQGFTFGSVKPETLHNQHSWRENHYAHQEASTSGGLYGSHLANYMDRIDIYGRLLAEQYAGEVSSCVPSVQAQGTVSDEFPHIAIINDLLDEDLGIGKVVNGYNHSFNRQYTFPCDTPTVDTGSLGGLCWLDQNKQDYGEDFQRAYGSSNGHAHGLRDGHLGQMEFSAYADGQIDGVIPNQWPYNHADSLMLNFGNVDANGYSYQLQEYLNSKCLDNGYNMYRSTGGL